MRAIHSFIIVAGVLCAPLSLISAEADADSASSYDGGFTRETYTAAFVAPSDPKDAPTAVPAASDSNGRRSRATTGAQLHARHASHHASARIAGKEKRPRGLFSKFIAWCDGHIPGVCSR